MQVIDRMGCIASHPILRNILSEKELELAAARKANQLQVKKDKKFTIMNYMYEYYLYVVNVIQKQKVNGIETNDQEYKTPI